MSLTSAGAGSSGSMSGGGTSGRPRRSVSSTPRSALKSSRSIKKRRSVAWSDQPLGVRPPSPISVPSTQRSAVPQVPALPPPGSRTPLHTGRGSDGLSFDIGQVFGSPHSSGGASSSSPSHHSLLGRQSAVASRSNSIVSRSGSIVSRGGSIVSHGRLARHSTGQISVSVYRSRHCSVQTACSGATPSKRCITCAQYDVAGQGIYCDACFEVRHPWYRVEHVWEPFEPIEPVVEEEPAASPRTETHSVIAMARETRKLLLSVKDLVRRRDMCCIGCGRFLTHPVCLLCARVLCQNEGLWGRGQTLCKNAIRRAEQNREELRTGVPHTHARKVQHMVRRRAAVKNLRRLTRMVYYKVYDARRRQWYYVNRETGATQWDKPLLLGPEDCFQKPKYDAKDMKPDDAAFVIQVCVCVCVCVRCVACSLCSSETHAHSEWRGTGCRADVLGAALDEANCPCQLPPCSRPHHRRHVLLRQAYQTYASLRLVLPFPPLA